MTDAVIFSQAVDAVDEAAAAVSDWTAASPCEGWTAADVLSHVTGTLEKVGVMLDGGAYAAAPATPETGGADGASALQRWQAVSTKVRGQISIADLTTRVTSPRGEVPLAEALALPTSDLACHAWDLAASQGADLQWSPELMNVVKTNVSSLSEEQLRRPGLFAAAVPPRDGASPTEQFMAFLGRNRPEPQGSGSW